MTAPLRRALAVLGVPLLAASLLGCANKVSTSGFNGEEHAVAQTISNLQADATAADEQTNLAVVRQIVELTGADTAQIEHVADRPGHDRRYSLSSEKVRALGWSPSVAFGDGLRRTVSWYAENAWWWEPIRSGEYRAYYQRQYGRSLR